jgi:hypothetical protein
MPAIPGSPVLEAPGKEHLLLRSLFGLIGRLLAAVGALLGGIVRGLGGLVRRVP